ncbi:hypothetical protein [Hydrogenophaga sp. ZJX-1]|uniref:hypothetical protein n=1 Tax=Hydrogenophaga sp. ZJX-1 TaxID=3404778 RepID=UPI003B27DBB3
MKKLLLAGWLFMVVSTCQALSPYTSGTPLPAGELQAQMGAVEKKLQAEGFTLLGRHLPKGLQAGGVVLVTDSAMLQAIRASGGSGIVAAAIRVGVMRDGRVSYTTPEYWYRAYLRQAYPQAEAAARSVQARLTKALGTGTGFGGDVPADRLANYQYMMSMERFDSFRAELRAFGSFDEALQMVRKGLANGVGTTAKVYEVVMADRKLAVFGVALNDAARGEGWWVGKLGAAGQEHMAALPYEIFIVDNKVYALPGRYRIALAWPSLSMSEFMNIRYAPDVILKTMNQLAEVQEQRPGD